MTRWRAPEIGLGALAAVALLFVVSLTMRQARDGSSFRTVLKTTQGATFFTIESTRVSHA